jgi:hypothetical protein
MAIQKFKFGQEITSSKLNEIVTFVNNLEGFLQSSQYWNQNVDSKIAVFQTQLNNIVNQVKGLLDSSESFETLLTAFIDLKAKYESLVTENVQVLLENIFNPSNISVNEDGFFVINGINTGVQLTTLIGPQGEQGISGTDGVDGSNGNTVLTGTSNPNNNNGVNGDLFLNVNNLDFYLKTNDVWNLLGNLKGPTGSAGAQGASAQILFRYQTDAGLDYLTEPPASNLIKFLEYKVVYSNETNQEIESKPWVRIQVRNDRFYPVLTAGTSGQLFLNWSSDETLWTDNPQGVNIRGPQGTNGINGTNGTNGTSVSILGSFESYEDLADIQHNPNLGDGYLIDGDLWVYTNAQDTGTPPNVNSVYEGFLNAGTIQGPAGPAPVIQAEVVATLNPAEEASVVVEPINNVEGGFKLDFSIPRGATGTRGSLIFSVATPEDLPTQASWNSITLLVNDLFIVVSTGEIRRLVAITPTWDLALVFTAAASVHTHSADNITSGVLPVSRGGTSATTTADVRVNLSLDNVNNTSDLNKPISTATQTALNLKANLASPAFTGNPTATTQAQGNSSTRIATTAFVATGLATKASTTSVTTLETNKAEITDLEWRFHGYTPNFTDDSYTIQQSTLYKIDGVTQADAFDIENFDYKFVYYGAVNAEVSSNNINDTNVIKLRLNGVTNTQRYGWIAQRIVRGEGGFGDNNFEDILGTSGDVNTPASSYIGTLTTLDNISFINAAATSFTTYNKLEFVISESYANSSSQSNGILMVEGEGGAVFGPPVSTYAETAKSGTSKSWFTGTLQGSSTLTSVTIFDTIGVSTATIELQRVQVYRRRRMQ